MAKSLLVVLGAGASYDVSLKNLPTDASSRPPLTNDIFDVRFDHILSRFPLARNLSIAVMARTSAGEQLEHVLSDYANSPSNDRLQRIREAVLYMQVLFEHVTSDYVAEPEAYIALIEQCQRLSVDVLFVTLNYDTLLEDAIYSSYPTSGRITSIEHYVSEARSWQLVKLHGSVDWGYPIGDANAGDPRFREVVRSREDWSHLGEPVFKGTNPVWHGSWWYPAMALPASGKYEPTCPESHIVAVRKFLEERTPDVLVIGTKGVDSNLLGLLEGDRAPNVSSRVAVVDPSEPVTVARAFSERIGGSIELDPIESGFAEWVVSRECSAFFDAIRDR